MRGSPPSSLMTLNWLRNSAAWVGSLDTKELRLKSLESRVEKFSLYTKSRARVCRMMVEKRALHGGMYTRGSNGQ